MAATKTLVLATSCDEGIPTAAHFRIEESPAPEAASLEEGAVLLRATHFSADPYQRGRFRSARPGATAPGSPVSGFISGVVVASKSPKWAAGDFFGGSLPLKTLQVVGAGAMAVTAMWKLTGLVSCEAELHLGVGVLGMPGATAYGGLLDVLRPKEGETLLITAASGAVGQLVGQLAKKRGVRVIGSAGGAAKCAALTGEFGFDAAIDYKGEYSSSGPVRGRPSQPSSSPPPSYLPTPTQPPTQQRSPPLRPRCARRRGPRGWTWCLRTWAGSSLRPRSGHWARAGASRCAGPSRSTTRGRRPPWPLTRRT